MSTLDDPQLEAILEFLKQERGFDFTGYKRSTLGRRIRRRMEMIGITSCTDYLDYLQVHPDEFTELFNTILINVTGFFRDRAAWDFLARQALPRLLREKPAGAPIRVWCAGVASGEEAYTIAMLLGEALGPEPFRERVKIYATDADEEALNQARQATYTAKDVEEIPEHLLHKYFERANAHYSFRKDLRRMVIFGRHDLVQDAPISRLDLLICRNTLMYFNAETQARILNQFHFGLNDNGLLFLGKAEMLTAQSSLFTPVDLTWRIFAKNPHASIRGRLFHLAQREPEGGPLPNHVRAREAAFDASPVAQIVLDRANTMIMANEMARQVFGIAPHDIGRPFQDLRISYRPAELCPAIEQASREQRAVELSDIEWPSGPDSVVSFDIRVTPLLADRHGLLGVSIAFIDVTHRGRLNEELQRSRQELETTLEELQSTVEELETTNEELQSTNEELETTNEELQSTNEELETMNEELQSTNEELETINNELRQRTAELNQVNAFLESIVGSLRAGVVVIDRQFRVHIWNRRAEDLWGLRADEVLGQHFLNLDIGLPIDQLRQPIRETLAGERDPGEGSLSAVNRRGQTIACTVSYSPLVDRRGDIHGVILLMEEHRGE